MSSWTERDGVEDSKRPTIRMSFSEVLEEFLYLREQGPVVFTEQGYTDSVYFSRMRELRERMDQLAPSEFGDTRVR